MLAFTLVIAFFCFWSFVGFSIVSALYTRRNLMQNALLAPVTGMGATVLLVMTLNWASLPLRYGGPAATAILVVLSAWLLRRFPASLPFRRLAPFGAVLLLAAAVTGYPMFRFGFNWVSYGNDDMANYCLGAKYFLNHGQFGTPSLQDVIGDRDASLFYWMLYVVAAIRHGVEELLSWAISLTGLSPHQAFMPMILAFELVLIASTGALILQNRKCRRAALMVCFAMALSALITLGTMYQLFGQVAGLGVLAGVGSVLLRRLGRSKSEIAFAGLLLASLGAIYPEVLPFLAGSYLLYHSVSLLKGKERVQDITSSIWPLTGFTLLFLNVTVIVAWTTLLDQVSGGMRGRSPEDVVFPYYMTPAGFAYLWGFRSIAESGQGIFQDLAIVAGAALFVVAILAAAWHTWKRKPVAAICLVMMALSFQLFRARADFGLFKIAMFMQPFLLGVMILTWDDLWNRFKNFPPRRFFVTSLLLLVIAFGTRGQWFYMIRSLGTGTGGLVEIQNASSGRLISRLQHLPDDQRITISDTSNVVLAKFEALYRERLCFTSKDFFKMISAAAIRVSVSNPLYTWYADIAEKLIAARASQYIPETFDMHGALPLSNHFSVRREIAGSGDFVALESGPNIVVTNQRRKTAHTGEFPRLVSMYQERNFLSFVASEFGDTYYGAIKERALGRVSLYQLQPDYFFRGSTMASLGRDSLFRIFNSSAKVRLVVEYTASLNADRDNRIPGASAIGNSRVMFPVGGRGSARLFSPAVAPQLIDGGSYVALDMGTWGRMFPNRRSVISNLWGRDIPSDNRRIVGFARDISLVSDDEYAALDAPKEVRTFPYDLQNKNLEYSGIYEDGWVAESSYLVLKQTGGASHLKVSAVVPELNGARASLWAAVLVDGSEMARKPTTSGSVEFEIPVTGTGRRRISLHFDRASSLPSEDGRPASALLRYVGFRP